MKRLLSKFKVYQNEILIFSCFILISLIVTHPLIFRMRSHLYGLGGDSFWVAWYFWWLKYAHLNQIPHLFCQFIASPMGVDYSQLLSSVVTNFFVKWLSISVNEIFTFNFFTLISFFLSALIVYYLVYFFTKNKLASMVSGIIYTLCPYHFARSACHLTLANIQWIPLYVLALFKLDEERSYRSALFCALAFSLASLSDYQYAYFISIFTVTFVVWRGWQGFRERRAGEKVSNEHRTESREKNSELRAPSSKLHFFKVVLVAAIIASAIILPPAYHSFRNMFATPERYTRPMRDLFSNSARPLGYLLPSQDNPFFGGYTKRFVKTPFYGGHPVEHTLYLGWVGIMLSIVAIREWRRKNKEQVGKWESGQVRKGETGKRRNGETGKGGNRVSKTERRRDGETERQKDRSQKAVSFFLFAGIVALLFSHSPYTEIGNLRILFPSYFMYKVLPMFRVYARFGIVVMLCVSVLAGIGLASILEKIRGTKKRRIFLSIVLLLIFIEFAPTLPAPMVNAVNPPPVYEWLSKQEGDFTIAEYPMENDQEYFFWQRIHQKRLVNGALSGTYADKVRKEIVDVLKPETPGILKYLGARYVILHPDKYLKSEDVPIIGEVPNLKGRLGLKLIKVFDEIEVYEVIAQPIKPTLKD